MAYSMDYRIAVARSYDSGLSSAEVAEGHGCSESWVRRLLQQRRERGTLEPRSSARKTSSRICTGQDEQFIRQLLLEKPDMTLAEVAAALAKPIHPGTVSRTLKRMKLPRKKSPRTPASSSVPT